MIDMNLKYLRKKYHYSQEDIAEKIGVTRQSVAKWENGDSLPDVYKCAELAHLFETSVEMLLYYNYEENGASAKDKFGGDGKYIFGVVKMGERGQIVVPKLARKVFDIKQGDRIIVLGDKEKGMAIAKIPNPFV